MLAIDHFVDVQIWVCCNERPNSDKPSCTMDAGQAILKSLREKLRGSEFQVWVNKSLCQGFCHAGGVTIVADTLKLRWQSVTLEDCDAIVTAIRAKQKMSGS